MKWLEAFNAKRTTPGEALASVLSGDTVYIQADTSMPQRLVQALVARAPELRDVRIFHLAMISTPVPYVEPGLERSFRHVAFFTGGAEVRRAIAEGRADFIPVFLSEIPALFGGEVEIDVALIHVSPPDEHGFCSFGNAIDVTKPAAESARRVIAQVNPNMPRSLGDSFIHASKIAAVVEVDDPLPELQPDPVSEVYRRIGAYIADMIEDGATLQMGIGAIPDAVLPYLREKRHLGIHTEMFSDGVMDLIDRGVITGERKTIHKGKIVSSFFMGTRKLYDLVDNNPLFEFHPCNYTNDPFVIAQNRKMISINSAIEVDLTGQVCADSIGPMIYSGIGGQVDFIRGAARSEGGRPIIALPSTAKGGDLTRIVPMLKPGAGVVTSRGDVHYVATEHGVASLHGQPIAERARRLIRIADPRFREELERYARERRWM